MLKVGEIPGKVGFWVNGEARPGQTVRPGLALESWPAGRPKSPPKTHFTRSKVFLFNLCRKRWPIRLRNLVSTVLLRNAKTITTDT